MTVDKNTGWPGISIDGVLTVTESEGGFGPDNVRVGNTDVVELISVLFDIKPNERGSLGEYLELGKVRLTIERMD